MCSITSMLSQEKPEIKLGGAFRFNYNYSDWKQNESQYGGTLGYDVFMLLPHITYGDFEAKADVRFYSKSFGGTFLKEGYGQYNINNKSNVKFGLTLVPFGIERAASNSFFYSIGYYIGFEDDDDMGAVYNYDNGNFRFTGGFFKNADAFNYSANAPTDPSRYGYDVAGSNKENNTYVAQGLYRFGDNLKSEIGASVLYGGLYNIDTEKMGNRYAFALNYELTYKNTNLKAEYIRFDYNPKNKSGDNRNLIVLAAYNAPSGEVAKGNYYTLGISHTWYFKNKLFKRFKIYNDYSILTKPLKGATDSQSNILGCNFSNDLVFIYIDLISGKNHAWLGGDSETAFAMGDRDAHWHTRFNMNFGIYF